LYDIRDSNPHSRTHILFSLQKATAWRVLVPVRYNLRRFWALLLSPTPLLGPTTTSLRLLPATSSPFWYSFQPSHNINACSLSFLFFPSNDFVPFDFLSSFQRPDLPIGGPRGVIKISPSQPLPLGFVERQGTAITAALSILKINR